MTDDASVDRLSLQETLDFTGNDLAENRAGQLSESQRRRLSARFKRSLVIFVALVATTVFLYVLYENIQTDQKILVACIEIGLVFGLCIFAIQVVQLFVDTRRGIVKAARGEVKFTRSRNNPQPTHLKIENIPILFDLFDGFEEGKHYIVYYAPWSKKAISAELLDAQPGTATTTNRSE